MFTPKGDDEVMNALEELEDVVAVDAALAKGGEPIPLEQVMKDLGWH